MKPIYHLPHTVTQPAAYLTGIEVLYDGGPDGFSLARLECEGIAHIGIRWNVARKEQDNPANLSGEVTCIGTPSVKGSPSWFLLPVELFEPSLFSTDNHIFQQVSEHLKLASK